jgi:hypothetical protein
MKTKLLNFFFSLVLLASTFQLQFQKAIVSQSNPIFSESTAGIIALTQDFAPIPNYTASCQGELNCGSVICATFYDVPDTAYVAIWPDVGLDRCATTYRQALTQQWRSDKFFAAQQVLGIVDLVLIVAGPFFDLNARAHLVLSGFCCALTALLYAVAVAGSTESPYAGAPYFFGSLVVLSYVSFACIILRREWVRRRRLFGVVNEDQ